ncbi:hypothetical protein PSEUDO8Z_10057 [Pseudomonas sp. 8Z]|nr:hypothetical protein PSEUDO8Z_10057 [Pseudomonas sp. 8Z]
MLPFSPLGLMLAARTQARMAAYLPFCSVGWLL